MELLEWLGWTSSILLAVCAIPQAIRSLRQGNSDGIDWYFLLLWFSGEVLGLFYVLTLGSLPLVINYVANLVCTLVILRFKLYPKGLK